MHDQATGYTILGSSVATGTNALASLPVFLERIHASVPLLVISHHASRASLQDLVFRSLGIDANPDSIRTVTQDSNPADTAVAVAHSIVDGGFDAIIALGGTTVIDIAKAASHAVAATSQNELQLEQSSIWNPFPGRHRNLGRIPIISIPTTLGTGGESSNSAILMDRSTRSILWFQDEQLRPSAVVVDPHMTRSLPLPTSVAGLLATIVHAIGVLSTREVHAITGSYAKKSLSMARGCLRKIGPTPFDTETRIQSGTASLLAGLAGCGSGQLASQSLALAVSTYSTIPYSQALAILVPYELTYRSEVIGRTLEDLAVSEPFYADASDTDGTPDVDSNNFPDYVATWIRDTVFTAGNPFPLRFLDMTMPDGSKALESIALGPIARLAFTLPGMQCHAGSMDEQDALRMLEAAYWGYPLDVQAIRRGYRHSFHRESL